MSLQKYAKHILYSEYFSVAIANLYTKKSFCKFFINYFSALESAVVGIFVKL